MLLLLLLLLLHTPFCINDLSNLPDLCISVT
jgi:hypothetical protein